MGALCLSCPLPGGRARRDVRRHDSSRSRFSLIRRISPGGRRVRGGRPRRARGCGGYPLVRGGRRARRRGAREEPRARGGEAGERGRARACRAGRRAAGPDALADVRERRRLAVARGAADVAARAHGPTGDPVPGKARIARARREGGRRSFRDRARARRARPRGGREAWLRDAPPDARGPPTRGRADRSLARDRGGHPGPVLGRTGIPAGRPARPEREDAPPPAAASRRSRRAGSARRPAAAAVSTGGRGDSDDAPSRSRRGTGCSRGRGVPEEGHGGNARAEGGRPRKGAVQARRGPRPPQPPAGFRGLRGLHEPRLAAPDVVGWHRGFRSPVGRPEAAPAHRRGREPARVGFGDGGVAAASGARR